MGKPPDFPEMSVGDLKDSTELYTQRPDGAGPQVNKRFTLLTLKNYLKSVLNKLYFRADGPLVNEYEFTLGGAFNWKGQRGLETHLDGNKIFIRPKIDAPVDGQIWTWDETLGEMVLKDNEGDKNVRIDVASATVWNLAHNLGFVPNYIARDTDGNILHGLQETIDDNNERITFTIAREGYVDFT